MRSKFSSPTQGSPFLILLAFLSASGAGLPERLTLRLTNASLAEALTVLQQRGDLDLVYGDDMVAGVMLTCDYRDQAPSELLTLILKDTGLACRWSEGGRAVIYPLPDHEVFTVEGFIASPNGTLPGATLEVLGSARVTTTDSRGAFSLTRLPRRRLQLRIGAEGYAQMTLEVKPERDRQPVSVLLAERPFLAEHLVVSKPFGDSEGDSIGGKLRISRPEEVIRHGTTSHDLFQGLRAIPGVDAGSREGGVSFRGARPSENLVLLEGIKLYQLDHALGHFSALNPDALGEVHIFKGAYPARYGNRVAGVMDIRAKGDLLGTREIRAGLDRDLGHATLLYPIGYQAAIMISARQSHSDTTVQSVSERLFAATFDQEQEDFEELDQVRTTRDFRFEDQMLRLNWRPNDTDSINLTLFRSRDSSAERVIYSDATFTATAFAKNGKWGNDGGSLRWSHQWNGDNQTHVQYAQSRYSNAFVTNEPFADEAAGTPLMTNDANRLHEDSFQLAHQVSISQSQSLTFGLFSDDVQLDYEESNSLGDSQIQAFDTRQSGMFWQLRQDLGRWHILLGIRAGKNRLSNTTFLEPRLALSYDMNAVLQWRASWGQFHQFVLRSPDTVNYFQGFPTWFPAFTDVIVPGFSEHLQAGLRWRADALLFDVEAYHKIQEGSLMNLFDPLRLDFEIVQIAETYRGLDMRVEKRARHWFAGLGYSYQHSRVTRDLTANQPLDFPTDRDRPHTLHGALSWTRDRWEFTAIGRYASGAPYEEPEVVTSMTEGEVAFELIAPEQRNALRLPDSHQLDARLNYALPLPREGVAVLGVSVTNLFDHRNLSDRFFTLEEGEESHILIPVDVQDFGLRMSFDLQIRF